MTEATEGEIHDKLRRVTLRLVAQDGLEVVDPAASAAPAAAPTAPAIEDEEAAGSVFAASAAAQLGVVRLATTPGAAVDDDEGDDDGGDGSGGGTPPPPTGGKPKDEVPPFASEIAMAQVLVERLSGNWHFITAEQNELGWYSFGGGCWRFDDTLGILHRSRGVCVHTTVRMEGQKDRDGRTLYGAGTMRKIASEQSTRAVARLARADPLVVRPLHLFDADPWILNAPDCMVDLKTGRRLAPDPTRLCMRMAGAGPAGDAPTWRRFLHEVTGGDKEYEEFLQRLAGYSLIGKVIQQVFVFIYGRSNTGKSLFVDTLQLLHGTYGCVAPMETFVVPKFDRGHPTDLAGFVGRRLVASAETEEGRRWDQQRIKNLTGDKKISARFMHGNFFEYEPQFLLMFHGNHKPRLSNADDAMRRRMLLLPFECRPVEIDLHLIDKLRAELPGIMRWAVEGCLLYQAKGLAEPPIVQQMTDSYFDAENTLGIWMAEYCELGPEFKEPTRRLYQSYKNFVTERGEYVFNEKLFVERLERVDGIKRPNKSGILLELRQRGWLGIKLRPLPTPLGLENHPRNEPPSDEPPF